MGGRRSISLALTALVVVALTAQMAGARVDRRAPYVASWIGRTGDLMSTGNDPGVWNVPDGRNEAVIAITFLRTRGELQSLWVDEGRGCYWRTWLEDESDISYAVGVTLPRRGHLLNDVDTLAINIGVRASTTLLLHVQEPWGNPCAGATTLAIHAVVDGVDHIVSVETP